MSSALALLERLEARASENPDACAITEAGGRTATRAVIALRARAFALGFAAAGLEPGDRVLFAVRPGIDAIALIIGIAEAGGVLVAAQLGVGDEVFRAQMELASPRWVVAESALLAAGHARWLRKLLAKRGAVLPSLQSLEHARHVRRGVPVPWGPRASSIGSIARLGAEAKTPLSVLENGPALVVFTSGTTGAPKAVEHSRGSLRTTLDIVSAQLDIAERDRMYAHELHLVLPALLAGAQTFIPASGAFLAERAVLDLRRNGITHMFAVTAHCQAIAEHLRSRNERLPAELRQILIGAAPVRVGFLERFASVLPDGARVSCVYGMTEMLPVAAVSLEEKLAWNGEGDLVGAPVPGVEATLSENGELLLRGPHLFTRYLGQAVVTQHATGDLARFDDGRIVLLGRAKDMIIRREYNIYPELHEPVIERIEGVRRAAMVGVYDELAADEQIVLVIEPEGAIDEERFVSMLHHELREGVHRIDLAALPDHILLLPIPQSGRSRKIDKAALRETVRTRLACASR